MKRIFILFLVLAFHGPAFANDFYNATGAPASGSSLTSATIRNEYSSVEDGFDKVSPLTGNGDLPVFINTGATAQEAISVSSARTKLGISATNTPFTPAGSIAATNVQTALAELDTELRIAANIINTPAGSVSAVTVQAAIDELDTEKVAVADVDDTPVNGATTAPISSNWAYDLLNSQVWTDVEGSRAFNSTYTNSTSNPITVMVTVQDTLTGLKGITVLAGGVQIASAYVNNTNVGDWIFPVTFVVPPGVTYRVNNTGGCAIEHWFELR